MNIGLRIKAVTVNDVEKQLVIRNLFGCLKVLFSSAFPDTVADGLKVGLGKTTWPIIRDNVTDVITVTEEEIISAMRLVWERMKLMIESSAAVGMAAVLSEKFQALPAQDLKNVGVILCGGNVDLDNLPWKK